jgi:hypothetical protein
MGGKKMTALQQHKVTAWMLENSERVASMNCDDLAVAAFAATEINMSDATAKRLRKGIGIVAVRPLGKAASSRTPAWKTEVIALEQRIDALEAALPPLSCGIAEQ